MTEITLKTLVVRFKWQILSTNLMVFLESLLGVLTIGSTIDLRNHYLFQFPLLSMNQLLSGVRWISDESMQAKWIVARVLELTYTAWDLQPFARDCGYDGPPFRWDEARRFLLRCELDDAMADAMRSGVPYDTRLDPPPADPRVAHGRSEE